MDYKHGHAKRGFTTATYQIWLNMKNRCVNPKNQAYHHYGGRRIKVCERWLEFKNFLSDMGEKAW